MHQLTDEDIIRMVLQGDTKAYAILVGRYSSYVYTLAAKLLGNSADAEEAAQDVFVKAHRALATYNGTARFSTWLYTITRNVCVSRTRGDTLAIVHKEEQQLINLGGHNNNIDKHQEQLARKTVIANALKKLPAEEAQIIILFYINEQTLEEICAILDISNSNAKVRLYRARKHLKEILDKYFNSEIKEYQREN